MLRVGIPRYRLPKDILDAEIEVIRRVGVEIRPNTKVESIDWLFEQGYDAVVLALGAHGGTKMRVPGEDLPGVIDCVSLLRDVSLGMKARLGNRVAVVGGGNAAIDASRTALRIGAKEVTILYRRAREDMPAAEEEIEEALQEGVNIDFLVAPSRISRENGHIRMGCVRMQLGEIDSSGRRRPEPVSGSEFDREFDAIVTAIGQVPQVPDEMELVVDKDGTIRADEYTLATDREGVFAAGDVVSGPASVIEAIAAGRQVAMSIDKYLGGEGAIDEILALAEDESTVSELIEDDEVRHRPEMPCLVASKRLNSFDVVERGFSEEVAVEEAMRCLKCDLEED